MPKHHSYLCALDSGLDPFAEPICPDDLSCEQGFFDEDVLSYTEYERYKRSSYPFCGKVAESIETVLLYNSLDSFLSEKVFAVPAPTFLAGEVDTTFTLAWHLDTLCTLPDWSAVLASTQRQGRGQLRREWHSPRGNLYVSFLLPNSSLFTHQAGAIILGYLILESLHLCGYPVKLKWPNDFVSREGKKVGGLLLEQRGSRQMAGLGLNLAKVPEFALLRSEFAYPAESLLHVKTGSTLASGPFSLWKNIVSHCICLFKQLNSEKEQDIFKKITEQLYLLHEKVAVFDGENFLGFAHCKGLDEKGNLLVCRANGSLWSLSSETIRAVDSISL